MSRLVLRVRLAPAQAQGLLIAALLTGSASTLESETRKYPTYAIAPGGSYTKLTVSGVGASGEARHTLLAASGSGAVGVGTAATPLDDFVVTGKVSIGGSNAAAPTGPGSVAAALYTNGLSSGIQVRNRNTSYSNWSVYSSANRLRIAKFTSADGLSASGDRLTIDSSGLYDNCRLQAYTEDVGGVASTPTSCPAGWPLIVGMPWVTAGSTKYMVSYIPYSGFMLCCKLGVIP